MSNDVKSSVTMSRSDGFAIQPGCVCFQRLETGSDLIYAATIRVSNACHKQSMLFKVMSKHSKRFRCKPNQGIIIPGEMVQIIITTGFSTWTNLSPAKVEMLRTQPTKPPLCIVAQQCDPHPHPNAINLLRRCSLGSKRQWLTCFKANPKELKDFFFQSVVFKDSAATPFPQALPVPRSHQSLRSATRPFDVNGFTSSQRWSQRKVVRKHGQEPVQTELKPGQISPFADVLNNEVLNQKTATSTQTDVDEAAGCNTLKEDFRFWKQATILARLPRVASALRTLKMSRQHLPQDIRQQLAKFASFLSTVADRLLLRASSICARQQHTAIPSIAVMTGGSIRQETKKQTQNGADFNVLCRSLANPEKALQRGETERPTSWPSGVFRVKKPGGYVWKHGNEASFRRFHCDGFFASSVSTPDVLGQRIYELIARPAKNKLPKTRESIQRTSARRDLVNGTDGPEDEFSITVFYGEAARCRKRHLREMKTRPSQRGDPSQRSNNENWRQVHSENSLTIRACVGSMLADSSGCKSTTVSVCMLIFHDGVFHDTLGRRTFHGLACGSKAEQKSVLVRG